MAVIMVVVIQIPRYTVELVPRFNMMSVHNSVAHIY
jgi:hypothetical protein